MRARRGAGRRRWLRRFTLAVRRCMGCDRTLGFALWPWSGSFLASTHGLCGACFERTVASRR